MSSKSTIVFFLCMLLFSIPLRSLANDYESDDEYDYEYKQKLILLQGKKSRLMDGHTRPAFNFNKKEALPYYLARGWTIQHIYFDDSSTPNNMYAYVVIEKILKVKKRFARRR